MLNKEVAKEVIRELNICVGLENLSLADVLHFAKSGLSYSDEESYEEYRFSLEEDEGGQFVVVCEYYHGGYGEGCFGVTDRYEYGYVGGCHRRAVRRKSLVA